MKAPLRVLTSKLVIGVLILAGFGLAVYGVSVYLSYADDLQRTSLETTREELKDSAFSDIQYTSKDDLTCRYEGIIESSHGELSYLEVRELAEELHAMVKLTLEYRRRSLEGGSRAFDKLLATSSRGARDYLKAQIDRSDTTMDRLQVLYDAYSEEWDHANLLWMNCAEHCSYCPKKRREALWIALTGLLPVAAGVGLMFARRKKRQREKETASDRTMPEGTAGEEASDSSA